MSRAKKEKWNIREKEDRIVLENLQTQEEIIKVKRFYPMGREVGFFVLEGADIPAWKVVGEPRYFSDREEVKRYLLEQVEGRT